MQIKSTLVPQLRHAILLLAGVSISTVAEPISNSANMMLSLSSTDLENEAATAEQCLRATNYYVPDHDLDSRFKSCRRTAKVKQGQDVVHVCPEFLRSVRMQGTGHVSVKGLKHRLHYSGKLEPIEDCKTAIGAAGQCLIPFVHIAADPKFYGMGDIIEVPALRYVRLPRLDGKGDFIHPGYFVVADTGGGIRGQNRFDFFVGRLNPLGKANPFGPFGKRLTDETHCNLNFRRISKRSNKTKAMRLARSLVASASGERTSDFMIARTERITAQ